MAVFTVNTTLDTVDADLADGLALDIDGNTSLRAAVMQANASPGDDSVNLPSGNYALTLTGPGGGSGGDDSFGDLDATDRTGSLVIAGAGAISTVVDAANVGSRVFEVHQNAGLVLSDLSVSGGLSGVHWRL